MRFDGDTAWLTQKMIAQLFSCSVENIILHLKHIYQDAELDESATTKDFLVVQKEGKRNDSIKQQLMSIGEATSLFAMKEIISDNLSSQI